MTKPLSKISSEGLIYVVHGTFIPDAQIERILQISPRIKLLKGMSKSLLEKAHVVYANNASFNMEDVPNLQWFQHDSAAVENIMDKPIAKSGIPIANVRGAYTMAVAELAIGLMLTLTRRIHKATELKGRRQWDVKAVRGENCYGKTMGIVGYGNIGRHIVKIADAMGMKILVCDNRTEKRDSSMTFQNVGDPEGKLPHAWYNSSQITEMFKIADVVVVILPSVRSTYHLIGRDELNALQKHAIVINVGRGSVIDEEALIECLRTGKISGAGLDVFESEPLEPEHPFWDLDNVVITPHIASYTSNQLSLAADILIENLTRYVGNRPLINVIDPAKGF